MRIKIVVENAAKIEAALLAVNGKTALHAYTTFAEIASQADQDKSVMSFGLPKSQLSGTRVVSTSGDRVANAYKYSRTGTRITMERGSSAWYLIGVESANLWSNGGGMDKYILTAEQDAYLRSRPCGYTVRTALTV